MALLSGWLGLLWVVLGFIAGYLTKMIIDRMQENENKAIKEEQKKKRNFN